MYLSIILECKNAFNKETFIYVDVLVLKIKSYFSKILFDINNWKHFEVFSNVPVIESSQFIYI